MKERPILMSAPMVRAILDGTKTQTRRAVKPHRGDDSFVLVEQNDGAFLPFRSEDGESFVMPDGCEHEISCPYGTIGDRLWVRETWMPDAPRDGTWPDTAFYGCKESPLSLIPTEYRKPKHCIFRSTWSGQTLVGWRPSIFMPRWASRITLEVTGVRVERLQDISEADAVSEGVYTDPACPAYDNYRTLWEQINGAGSWALNPWVWVISFKVIA